MTPGQNALLKTATASARSVVDGIMRCSNLLIGGKRVTVIGYGYCGQGIARALRGLGAHVTIVDIDPLTRLEAHLEGYHTI